MPHSASAQAVLTFEGLADLTPVTTQFAGLGVTFANATAITSGISLNEIQFPPNSGISAVFDDGAPITGNFSTPVSSFSGLFTYITPITITAFDAANSPVGSATSLFSVNTASSGNVPNEVLTVSSSANIVRFSITGLSTGSSFVLDDFRFTQVVPEPSSAVTFLLAGGACGGLWKRSRKKQRK